MLAGKQERDVSYARRAPEPSSCTEQGTPSFHNCGKERDTGLGHFVVGGKQEGDTSNSRRRCDFHGANTNTNTYIHGHIVLDGKQEGDAGNGGRYFNLYKKITKLVCEAFSE